MGKIFEFSEIYKIPGKNDFPEAKSLLFNRLSDPVRKKEIYGAKVFGSVALGTPNIRSDFDLLIITQKDYVLGTLKGIFNDVFEKTKVRIEPLIVDRKLAEKGFHSISPIFAENIKNIPIAGNIVGENPTDILKPSRVSLVDGHTQYLIQKIRRFKEGMFTYSDTERNRVLQRALEAPVNMGRETLQILPHLGFKVELKDIGKSSVVDKFNEVFNGNPLIEGFNYLYKHDLAYTNFLNGALDGLVERREYNDYVNHLSEECIPQAIDWTRELSLIHLNLLEGNARLKEGNNFPYRGKERF